MKYENFEQVRHLCAEISERQAFLNALENDEIHVIIKNHSHGRAISTIGVGDFEHSLTPLATEFIEKVKQDTQMEINKLHERLEVV